MTNKRDSDGVPLEFPGTNEAAVSDGLRRLYGDAERDSAELGRVSFVPGFRGSSAPPASFPALSLSGLAAGLEANAERETSALAKSRALLVASQLWQHEIEVERALSAGERAFETSPKLAMVSQLLRKKARAQGKQELLERCWETTSRLATSPKAREQARLGLVDFLRRKGQPEAALKHLDQGAREGSSDPALLLRRLISRMAQRSSLAGLKIPHEVTAGVALASELLGETLRGPSSETEEQVGGLPEEEHELAPLRAARALSLGETTRALAFLAESDERSKGPHQEDLLELEASLRLIEPDGAARSLALLRRLVEQSPSRNRLRSLAQRAVECHNAEAVTFALERAESGSNTFDPAERWFLSAVAGVELKLSVNDAESSCSEYPILGLALGPHGIFVNAHRPATVPLLLAQLGAGFHRLTTDDRAGAPLTSAAEQALCSLESQGEEREICSVLRFSQAQYEQDDLGIARGVGRLSERFDSHSGRLIAAMLHAEQKDSEAARTHFEAAFSQGAPFSLAAARGLLALPGTSGAGLLQEVEATSQHPALSFALALERCAFEETQERRIQLAFDGARQLSETSLGRNAQTEGLRTALVALHAKSGDVAVVSEERSRLSELGSRLATQARLRSLWQSLDGSEFGAGRLSELSDSPDLSERLLVYFCEAQPDRTTLRPASFEGEVRSATASGEPTAYESLLNMVQNWGIGRSDRVGKFSPACAHLDKSIEIFAADLGEIQGETAAQSAYFLTASQDSPSDDVQRYAYERLSELDERRGNAPSSLLWQRTLIEKFPKHLPSLLRLEESLLSRGGRRTFYIAQLASALPTNDRLSYELLAGTMAIAKSDLRDAGKHLLPLLEQPEPSLILLRSLSTIFRERRDDEGLARCASLISQHARSNLDKSYTSITAALIQSRLGRFDEARTSIAQSLGAIANSFSAHQLRDFLNQDEASEDLAARKEEFAHCAAHPEHRAQLWFEAAEAWSSVGNPSRAALALEQVLSADPGHAEAFSQLKAHHESASDSEKVERLISARLIHVVSGSQEQLDLEMTLARILSERGEKTDALIHFERALTAHPDDTELLWAHAELATTLGTFQSAERSLVALRQRLEFGETRVDVLRALGNLYSEHLDQLERAMDCFEEVAAEAPDDVAARQALVKIYARLNLAERATSLQTLLIKEAPLAEDKRAGALILAGLYEGVARDPKRAEATLERVRQAWPLDADVLEATIQFMDRHKTTTSRSFLLDRARRDTRRKLEEGKLDGALLDTLARIAKLSGETTIAQSTAAARVAFLGLEQGAILPGAGLNVLSPEIDELVAPSGLVKPLRDIIRKTGPAMDAAFSVDLSNMGAQKISGGATFERLQFFAARLNVTPPELFVSMNLGARCLPITSQPPRLLMGASLDEVSALERDYLLLRAIKLLLLGAGALARSKDEDRWPMLVALLQLFSPQFSAHSAEPRKVTQAKALIEQGLARVGYDEDVPTLALEAVGAIGDQQGGFGDKSRMLANRAALLGVGDLTVTLNAIAAGAGKSLPEEGPSRFRWVEAHPEAKDLVLFSTTEKCARAREAMGIGAPSETPLPEYDIEVPSVTQGTGRRPQPPKRS